MKFLAASSLIFALSAVSLQASGASVQVDFPRPERYTDVDRFTDESSRAMKAIQETLVDLGNRYLPQNASLRVEVLDIDLAGRLIPSARTGKDIRLQRGNANPPNLRLRYVLESNGRVVEKEETLQGVTYLRTLSIRNASTSFPYEKAMLERWFRESLAGPPAASGS
jgi:hypothetical protein